MKSKKIYNHLRQPTEFNNKETTKETAYNSNTTKYNIFIHIHQISVGEIFARSKSFNSLPFAHDYEDEV